MLRAVCSSVVDIAAVAEFGPDGVVGFEILFLANRYGGRVPSPSWSQVPTREGAKSRAMLLHLVKTGFLRAIKGHGLCPRQLRATTYAADGAFCDRAMTGAH